MLEQNAIQPSATALESPTALPAREPFVAPRVEDLGDMSTLTLLGGSL